VLTPELPWSLARLYDASFHDALQTLDTAAQTLRRQGCDRVLLGGHSMGANAAIACARRHASADGLMVLGPGHFPDWLHHKGISTDSLARSASAVATGERERLWLTDVFQGRPRPVRIPPEHYLEYFAPDGPAVMPDNCRHLQSPLPLLWVVGRADAHFDLGRGYAYALAPHHPASAYHEIDADHIGTPRAATQLALAWLARTFPESA
jgi:pimeloyl-ACP methyl ester carboxylesterase